METLDPYNLPSESIQQHVSTDSVGQDEDQEILSDHSVSDVESAGEIRLGEKGSECCYGMAR